MIWSERMAHFTLKNNEMLDYFHIGFQYKSINTNFISIIYLFSWTFFTTYLGEVFQRTVKKLSIDKSIQTNQITKFHYSVVSFHSFNHSSYNLHIHTQLK